MYSEYCSSDPGRDRCSKNLIATHYTIDKVPVCGSNKVTYSSHLDLFCESKTKPGVYFWEHLLKEESLLFNGSSSPFLHIFPCRLGTPSFWRMLLNFSRSSFCMEGNSDNIFKIIRTTLFIIQLKKNNKYNFI
jgi:hypothetical protein